MAFKVLGLYETTSVRNVGRFPCLMSIRGKRYRRKTYEEFGIIQALTYPGDSIFVRNKLNGPLTITILTF